MHWTRDLIAVGIYLIILIGLFILVKQKKLIRFTTWTGGFLVLYFCALEIKEKTFYLLIPLFFFLLFYYFYKRNKVRLKNGWLFNLFLVSFMGYLVIMSITTQSLIAVGILLVLLTLFLFTVAFGLYAAIIFLIGNSFVVLRHESRKLPNLLTLILGLAILAQVVIQAIGPKILPDWSLVLLAIPTMIILYFFSIFWNFLSISLLYQLNRPAYQQHFIIVLGAGLINGETVTPLLAQRIDRAIQFYRNQTKVSATSPQLLMSGGQGPDEKVPEAQAMRAYALAQGIPAEDILMEAQSTNTFENMRFSQEIMEREKPFGYQAIFVSNNYHIFRAGMYADQVGLKIDGIGSKTARYFLPNAFLREFIAIASMHKHFHFVICGLITLTGVLLAIFNYFFLG